MDTILLGLVGGSVDGGLGGGAFVNEPMPFIVLDGWVFFGREIVREGNVVFVLED